MNEEKAGWVKQDISLVFLDVDGCLNTYTKNNRSLLSVSHIHIERLKQIIESTTATCKICISSTWRLYKYAIIHLKKKLSDIGNINVESVIIGKTPNYPIANDKQYINTMQRRVLEIKQYLKNDVIINTKYNVISYVVIDDMDLSSIGANKFVKINPEFGITDFNVYQIISILNQITFNEFEIKQKLNNVKLKQKIKLLFIALSSINNDYNTLNVNRLQIILKKTNCELVITKNSYNDNLHDIYNGAKQINNMISINEYITELETKYNIQSWAVLDYTKLYQQYEMNKQKHFVKINPSNGLILDDVLYVISILNKWS